MEWAKSPHSGRKKGFILLNMNLWKKKKIEIDFIIAHESAHAFKRHIKTMDDVTGCKVPISSDTRYTDKLDLS